MDSTLPAKKALKIETGFVGYFDILGYKSFLASGITDVTFKVIELLKELRARVEAALEKFVGPDFFFKTMKPDLDRIQYRVFSDAIFLTYVYEEGRERPGQAASFVVAANVLQHRMFADGLPVRGAISFGDFILGESAFAGKPILDACELGDSLDLAACAIHETAENEFAVLLSGDAALNNILDDNRFARVRYLAPVKKTSPEEELSCLNLAWPPVDADLETLPDLRQYIYEQCMANGKQICLEAVRKIENTERFLRFLQTHLRKIGNREA